MCFCGDDTHEGHLQHIDTSVDDGGDSPAVQEDNEEAFASAKDFGGDMESCMSPAAKAAFELEAVERQSDLRPLGEDGQGDDV